MKKKSSFKGDLNENKVSFPRNVVGNLPLFESFIKEEKQPNLINQVEDARQKPSGMTTNFMAFTLIELLVVVLIIGILAAVALPQYQFAVAKARINRLLPLMKSIENAQEVYKMEIGTYANEFALLDIDMPAGSKSYSTPSYVYYTDFNCRLASNSLYCNDAKYVLQLERYYRQYTICWAWSDKVSQKLCKYLCQTNTLGNNGECRFSAL